MTLGSYLRYWCLSNPQVQTEDNASPLRSERTPGKGSTQAPHTRTVTQTLRMTPGPQNRTSRCFHHRKTHLVHRRDLVPLVFRGVVHIYLGRVIPVERRTGRAGQSKDGRTLGVNGRRGRSSKPFASGDTVGAIWQPTSQGGLSLTSGPHTNRAWASRPQPSLLPNPKDHALKCLNPSPHPAPTRCPPLAVATLTCFRS